VHCPKCGRSHTGICGIPAGVTKGFGARIGGIKKGEKYRMNTKAGTKLKADTKSTDVLCKLLDMAKEQETKVKAMLNVLPSAMSEYDELQERLEKVMGIISTLNQQIAGRHR